MAEGFLAGTALLTQGADFSAGEGLSKAREAARTVGLQPFGRMGAGSIKYDTGSSVDLDSFIVTAGLVHGSDLDIGNLTVGAFVEYGHGNYDTYNGFTNLDAVHGGGDTDFVGGGLLGRQELAKGRNFPYVEGSVHAGQVKNEFTAADLRDFAGTRAKFDSSSAYFSAHVAGGYVLGISEAGSLDLYARYLWTHADGDDVKVSTGETVNFDAIDSQRTQLGARMTWVTKYVSPYVGAAWEHEFDGKAAASVSAGGYTYALGEPSMTGDTGIGEIGVTLAQNIGGALIGLDLGLQGYIGVKEGVAVTARLSVNW